MSRLNRTQYKTRYYVSVVVTEGRHPHKVHLPGWKTTLAAAKAAGRAGMREHGGSSFIISPQDVLK
jgi:hypothetical protein